MAEHPTIEDLKSGTAPAPDQYSLFLTKEEIVELTGYKNAAKQCAHLKTQRIPFHTNRAGHPKVARTILEGGRRVELKPEKTWSPSWG